MFMKRDFRYGTPYYKYVGDSTTQQINAIFSDSRISDIFGSIYIRQEFLDGQDEEGQPKKSVDYSDVGINAGNMKTDFLTLFENCQWSVPFYTDSDEGNSAAQQKLAYLVNQVLDENEFKYRKLAETLGFVYDPMEDFFEKYGGSDEIGRVYSDKVNYKQIDGPITGITYDSTTKTYTFNFDEIKRVGKEIVGGTTTRNGAEIDGVSSTTTRTPNQGGGYTDVTTNTITYGTDTPVKTKQYKTTMDSAAEERLAGYTVDEGSIASSDDYIEKQEYPVTGKVIEGSAVPSYTDTKTLGSSKSGRHVAAADLIEAERNVAKFSLQREFFDDLKKKLLISGWD